MLPVSVIIIVPCVLLSEKRGRSSSSEVTRGMAACYCHYRGNSNILFNKYTSVLRSKTYIDVSIFVQLAQNQVGGKLNRACLCFLWFALVHSGWCEICQLNWEIQMAKLIQKIDPGWVMVLWFPPSFPWFFFTCMQNEYILLPFANKFIFAKLIPLHSS